MSTKSIAGPPENANGGAPEHPRLEAFRSWMSHHRGVVASTLDGYCRILRGLLSALGDDPVRYTAEQVRGFVLEDANRHGSGHAQQVPKAVRNFLRYLASTGQCATGLVDAVPTVACWRRSSLPRFVSASEVERVVSACDRRTSIGLRDYAVLLLLSRLGLRAFEVAALRVADIDSESGRLLVHGKGGRQDPVAIPQDVGDAILAWLERRRPAAKDDRVFVRVRQANRPLGSHAIGEVVRRAIDRAGVKPPSRGSHLLRHSLATHMVRQGAPLAVIAKVLRHRSIETTTLYAKVDLALLKEVAQPWPEVTPW